MCIDDEGLPILDHVVLVSSPHEDDIPQIHVGAYKYYTTFIKWYYIYLHFSDIVRIYRENFILHYLVTSNFAFLFTHPNEYG